MFNLYPFDIDADLTDGSEYPMPVIHELYDGMRFDLGGGRIVTAYECPGHSKGEMIFLDEQTRTLFCGDALNFNLGVGAEPVSPRFPRARPPAGRRLSAQCDRDPGGRGGRPRQYLPDLIVLGAEHPADA